MTQRAFVNLTQDPIVEALVPDPGTGAPRATVLTGYLGRSMMPGTWRLYLTPALDDYVEIPENQILHTSQLPDGGGTRVWVPKTLELEHVRTITEEVHAGFLDGAIVKDHLPAANPMANLVAAAPEMVAMMRLQTINPSGIPCRPPHHSTPGCPQ